jgi:hypothetical protein
MEAKECRIGNSIYFISDDGTKIEVTVRAFRDKLYCGTTQYVDADNKNLYVAFSMDRFEPIPLTEEWHNKLGSQKNGFGNHEYHLTHRKKIVFSGDYIYLRDIERMDGSESMEDNICTLWNNDFKRRGMFVHEWQNLYYALINEELLPNE